MEKFPLEEREAIGCILVQSKTMTQADCYRWLKMLEAMAPDDFFEAAIWCPYTEPN